MLYTLIDIETTSFRGDTDICSVAYMIVDKYLNIKEAEVMYFYLPTMIIDHGAYEVHGLTKEFLKRHEGSFEDNLYKLFKAYNRRAVVAHNVQFDSSRTAAYLDRQGLYATPAATLCTMKYFTGKIKGLDNKRPKLCELVEGLEISENEILKISSSFNNGEAELKGYHSASYDVAAMYLALKKNANYINLLW